MERRLAEMGIVAGSYDGCEMCQVAAMLGANDADPDAPGVIENADPSELIPAGWSPR